MLAFALYVTLKRVNSPLAQLGLIFCLADSFLALVVRMCSFVRLHLYVSAGQAGSGLISAEQWSELLRTIAATTETVGGISFGIGSCLFFYLFLTSRYIPKVIALLGCAASSIWTALYFAGLIFPERHTVFGYICFPPMALAEVVTGAYLVLFAVGKRRAIFAVTAPSAMEI